MHKNVCNPDRLRYLNKHTRYARWKYKREILPEYRNIYTSGPQVKKKKKKI